MARQPRRRDHRLAFGGELRGDLERELPVGGVAHGERAAELVALAHEGRERRVEHHVLGRPDRRIAGAEQPRAAVRDGDDPERGQRVVERHLDPRLAARVERHARLPQEEGVEELAARLPAAAASRARRLLAEVALAHHLHLSGRGRHLFRPPLHHRLEQLPGLVRGQLEQALVDRGERDLGLLRRRPAVGAFHRHLHERFLAHLVGLAVGGHADLQVVRRPTDVDLGDPQLERRLAQVDGRLGADVLRRLTFGDRPERRAERVRRAPEVGERCGAGRQPSADRQHGDVDIRRMAALQRQLDHRLAPGEAPDVVLDHALAFDRDEGGRFGEGHPHLEARPLARLVALLLRDDVHAIVVAESEPPPLGADDVLRARGNRGVAGAVAGPRPEDHLARGRRFQLAEHQPLRVGAAGAAVADPFRLAVVLVRVEAADQALAVRVERALEEVDRDLDAGGRLAGEVERQHLEAEPVLRRRPAFGADPEVDSGRPQRDARRGRERLAVRVLVLHLDDQVLRTREPRELVDRRARGAVLVELERDDLRHLAGGRRAR